MDISKAVERALAKPLDTARLRNLCSEGMKAVIVIDDRTRDLPSHQILPPIINELEAGGLSRRDIKILIATGIHRTATVADKRALVGELYGSVRVFSHNAYKNLTAIGRTSAGTEIRLNRYFCTADLRIVVSDVEFHQILGYGGGAKSVHPGLADADSVERIHARMLDHDTGAGRLDDNPARAEVEEIARKVGIHFAVTTVLSPQGQPLRFWAGSLERTFREGVKLANDVFPVELEKPVDLAIASAGGYPRDIDLCQAQKAIEVALKATRKGGAVVLFAECPASWGSATFHKWAYRWKTRQEVMESIEHHFFLGGHKVYQLARESEHAQLYIYTTMRDADVRCVFLEPIHSPRQVEALARQADSIAVFPYATVAVIKGGRAETFHRRG